MVVQKAINNLKERPKDERATVAGGVAVGIVIILLLGWGFLFLKKIQREGPSYDFGPTSIKDFGWNELKAVGEGIQGGPYNPQNELRSLRGAGSGGSAVTDRVGTENQFFVPSEESPQNE